ncbi:MAG: 3-phosphoshikimate 1-carboxyvinyltransferase, partial [Actinomycetota bacterium]|nr:3-phosphoshikimate 1-carboxyvinyltransferase [Actinomycetota bacterium]
MTLWCTPVERPFHSTIRVPGSKSIANRALICAALSEGRSTLKNLPEGDDTSAMLSGLHALGIEVTRSGSTATVSRSTALQSRAIHAELAGTTSRFLTALAATAESKISIDGHERLRQRPIGPLLNALRSLGAQIVDHDGGLPVSVHGPLRGGAVTIDATTSSQFISALMMIGPVLPEGLHITLQGSPISQPYVNLTASLMELFGVSAEMSDFSIRIAPQEYSATSITIEPDASSASYPLAIAAATGSTVTIEDFGSSSLQGDKQIIDILRTMNADIDCTPHSTTLTSNGNDLEGIDIDMSDISDLVPTVAALACFAVSRTRIRGVGFIRNKES